MPARTGNGISCLKVAAFDAWTDYAAGGKGNLALIRIQARRSVQAPVIVCLVVATEHAKLPAASGAMITPAVWIFAKRIAAPVIAGTGPVRIRVIRCAAIRGVRIATIVPGRPWGEAVIATRARLAPCAADYVVRMGALIRTSVRFRIRHRHVSNVAAAPGATRQPLLALPSEAIVVLSDVQTAAMSSYNPQVVLGVRSNVAQPQIVILRPPAAPWAVVAANMDAFPEILV